jgi:hypothetical protein
MRIRKWRRRRLDDLPAGGELHLDFPGIPFVRPIYVQMLGLPVSNPGYRPGRFTNALAL